MTTKVEVVLRADCPLCGRKQVEVKRHFCEEAQARGYFFIDEANHGYIPEIYNG